MGCGSSAPSSALEGDRGNGTGPRRAGAARAGRGRGGAELPSPERGPVKPPLAFEISLDEPLEDPVSQGIVKRHPPLPARVLQRLHPVQETNLTLEDLQSKLESAEKRRMSILQSRIASANKASRQASRMLSEMKDDTVDLEDPNAVQDMVERKNNINAEGT